VSGLTCVYAILNVPVAFWLLTPFIQQLPREIEEAAALDGAAMLATFIHIVLPMIAPGLVATALILLIFSYDEFLLASSLTFVDATRTLPVGISLFQGERLVNFGQMAAASLTGIAPLYFFGLVGQRWLVRGLSHGAIKS
jgi:multiple sugar transport system permease protein